MRSFSQLQRDRRSECEPHFQFHLHASSFEAGLNSLPEQLATPSLANEFVRFWCAVTCPQRNVDFFAVSPICNARIKRRPTGCVVCERRETRTDSRRCLTCARLRTLGRRNPVGHRAPAPGTRDGKTGTQDWSNGRRAPLRRGPEVSPRRMGQGAPGERSRLPLWPQLCYYGQIV